VSVDFAICNGFRVRGLNADCSRLAVQSTHQTTWELDRRKWSFLPAKVHDVALGQSELKVLRAYEGACPEFEIEPMGQVGAMLLVECTRQNRTQGVRVGARARFALAPNESVVVRVERMMSPVGPLDMSPHVPY
jgi:hypothetical protein